MRCTAVCCRTINWIFDCSKIFVCFITCTIIGHSLFCKSLFILGCQYQSQRSSGVEQLFRKQQVDGSNPSVGSTVIKNLVSGAAPAPEPWERVAHGGSSGNRSGPSHVPQGVFRRLAGLSAVDPCNPPVTLVDLVAVVGDARLDQEPIRRRRVVLSYDLVGRVGIRAAAHAM